MRKRLTVLTPVDLADVISEIASEFELKQMTLDTYDDSREVVDLYERYRRQTDAFLLGGPIAYHHLIHHLDACGTPAKVLIQYVPYNEVSIYRALFGMAQAHDFRRCAELSVSIDHPAGKDVQSCIDEIQLNLVGLVSHEVTTSEKIDELLAFHWGLWTRGEVSAILTSVYYVYRRMREAGAPVYRIMPAKSSVRAAVQGAIAELKELGRKDKQIAVVIVRFCDAGLEPASSAAYQIRKKRVSLEHLMRSFAETLHGLVQWPEPNLVAIVSTRGQVEPKLAGTTDEMLQKISEEFNILAVAGVGFADAAHDAYELGSDAVASAESVGQHCIVAADVDGTVRRQGRNGQVLEYGRRSDEPDILCLSKRTGLGVATINKIASHAQQSPNPFTANCIASSLSITPRSARKILHRLEAAGFIGAVGEEQPLGSGRPRRMFRVLSAAMATKVKTRPSRRAKSLLQSGHRKSR